MQILILHSNSRAIKSRQRTIVTPKMAFAAVGLKYANKRKDAKTQTLVKSEFSATSIRLRI